MFKDWCDKHQQKWTALMNSEMRLQFLPEKLSDILIADFDKLVKWYYTYQNVKKELKQPNVIVSLFKYKGQNQSRISEFFMNHSEELEIGTCHYCDTAYINVYRTGKRNRNHFDIDHFLPKCMCPVTSLSLFNFVPSCPICNERLKGNQLLGRNENENIKLSPTSDSYEFSERVKIQIIPIEAYPSINYQDNPDMFKVLFHTDSKEYKKAINIFKLDERYDFHKGEALRLMDLLQDYPESHINMIAKVLGKEPSEVDEDIFGDIFVDKNRRTFAKLHNDIINQYNNKPHE